jgi:DNA-binding transcriptional regulator GbsR (MarR family)
MKESHLVTLEKFGLSTAEAQIYLSLTRAGAPMRASAIVAATGVPRGSIYPTLSSLVEKGIVENGKGYGSQFAAVPAEEALSRLIAAEKEKLSEAESVKANLITEIESRANAKQNVSEANLVEVIRDSLVYSGVLIGDVNSSSAVDGNDVSALQTHIRQPVNSTTFRYGVNATGATDGSDVSATQGQIRTSLR